MDKRRLESARSAGGIVLNEESMRRTFNRMDVNGDGTMDIEEFRAFVDQAIGDWDPTWNQDKIDKALAHTGGFDDGILEYSEFAALLLHLANT